MPILASTERSPQGQRSEPAKQAFRPRKSGLIDCGAVHVADGPVDVLELPELSMDSEVVNRYRLCDGNFFREMVKQIIDGDPRMPRPLPH
jgi:hypothetical protein